MDNDYFLDAGIGIPLLYQFPSTDGLLDSALSSIVSSPGSASNSNEGFAIRELIGKLGNICNSGDPNYALPHPGTSILPAMPGDSGFADRAARFSSFRSRSFNCRNGSGLPPQLNPARKLNRVLSSPSLKVNGFSGNCGIDQGQFRKSEENSSQTGSRPGSASSKKRKSPPKSKSKQIPSSSPAQANQTRTDPIAKRAKSGEEDKEKEAEPQKDYIHVRARRGQATDSHSLAERVRREKISERMKLLQDIVPGCNKVTGKALMLEEIINYVQSLQRQVEYLSMKLASTSTPPSIEFNPSNYFQNDIFQPNCSNQMDALAPPNVYGFDQSHGIQLPTTEEFMNDANELKSVCEGDLHTIVDMGFRVNTLYTG